jgi:transposase
VTLALLWEEYRGHYFDGYGYSRFCDIYVEWRHGITATMRQTHAAAEKLFVDFAGDTLPVFDRGAPDPPAARRGCNGHKAAPTWYWQKSHR